MHAPRSAIISLASATAVGGAYDGLIVRPRISCWGATDEEVRRSLPGDELPSPYGYRPISTRAVTIDAPPEEVWPWLVQMGSGRAGFYTHEWVERLLFITYAEGRSVGVPRVGVAADLASERAGHRVILTTLE